MASSAVRWRSASRALQARQRRGDVLGDVSQDFVILVGIVDALGVALNKDRSQGLAFCLERRADAILVVRAFQLNFFLVDQLVELIPAVLDRFARANDVTGHAVKAFQRLGGEGLILLVHKIREAQQPGRFIVQGDKNIFRVHQLADDAMDAGKKLLHVVRGAGSIGDLVEGGLDLVAPQQLFRALFDLLLQGRVLLLQQGLGAAAAQPAPRVPYQSGAPGIGKTGSAGSTPRTETSVRW